MPISDEVRKLTDSKPFYAMAGAGDLAVEKLRELPAQLKELQARQAEFRTTAQELPGRARGYANSMGSKAETYARDLPGRARVLPGMARKYADTIGQRAAELYDEFATRGRKVVSRVSGGAALELEEVSESAVPPKATPIKPAASAKRQPKASRNGSARSTRP
jgi:hypothetical protein